MRVNETSFTSLHALDCGRLVVLTIVLIIGYIAVGVAADIPGMLPRWDVIQVRYELAAPLFLSGLFPPFVALCWWRLQVRHGGQRVNGWPGWRAGFTLAYRAGWFTTRPLGYYGLVLALPIFFWSFGSWKAAIPPFTAERELARLSTMLHGGPAYTIFAPFVTPQATEFLEQWYSLWWYMFAGVILWRGWCGSPLERARFWFAFVLMWIVLGTIIASLVPSAGPWYYARVTGEPGPFQPLISYLVSVQQTASPGAVSGLEGLWRAQESGAIGLGAGISAFPSLHVAMPVLAACATWRLSRIASMGFAVFAGVILVASVHLGWHYAIDGEASALLVPLIWWASGRLAGKAEAHEKG